jgi:hypothetical protein
LLAACGGGGGGSSAASTPPAQLTNFATLTVDAGPAILNTGPNAYTQDNVAYVSVTLCAPGSTTNCQTIDHVQVDTGSVGLRIFQSVLNTSLLAALPSQTDTSGNPVGECYGYVDGYVFGSVRSADFSLGGESVAGMPFQVVADGGQFANVPSTCSSGGGTNLNTVQTFGSNGIIGIGVTPTDCGSACQATGGYGAAIYYDCPTAGCSTIITRNSATAAPFQQLPNPVAAFPVDNNGTIISLPSVAAGGAASISGTLYFGIGTQTNNALGSATVLTTTTDASSNGAGLLTATYKNQTLNQSFIDSGSNLYLWVDSTIAQCTQSGFSGYYCPATSISETPTLQGQNGMTASAAFTLANAQTQFSGNNASNAAVPGIGGDTDVLETASLAYSSSFDFGLPFFFGRKVYTAIEGRGVGVQQGPFIAY